MADCYAREYKGVPKPHGDDNVIPSVSAIPSILNLIRHPRRNRTVSVGPQSEADAHEVLAFRDRRRRESSSSLTAMTPLATTRKNASEEIPSYLSKTTSTSAPMKRPSQGFLPTPAPSKTNLSEQVYDMDDVEDAVATPLTPSSAESLDATFNLQGSENRADYEREEREMFSKLEKPRVRYDVEVVTKLIVYAGTNYLSIPAVVCLLVIRDWLDCRGRMSVTLRDPWTWARGRNVMKPAGPGSGVCTWGLIHPVMIDILACLWGLLQRLPYSPTQTRHQIGCLRSTSTARSPPASRHSHHVQGLGEINSNPSWKA